VSRRIPLAPAEGWSSLLLVLLLVLTMAWSLDDAAVVGNEAWTDFLPFAAIGGVIVGFIGAKAGWYRWVSHVLGAIAGAIVVPLFVGSVLVTEGSLGELFEATALSVGAAWNDLVWRGMTVTPEYGHFLLVIGLFVWGTGMFAAYAMFGHQRPLGAILVVGIVLAVNMGFTTRDQLLHMALFSLAALFLLIRSHALDEQAEWIRRRIGDPSDISGLYLRGGALFIAVAILGSVALARAASSAPLADAWREVGSTVISWSRDFEGLLPRGGTQRPLGAAFGNSSRVAQSWSTDSYVAARVDVPLAEAQTRPYWRAVTLDSFDGAGVWDASESARFVERASLEDLLEGTAEEVDRVGFREFEYTVTIDTYIDRWALTSELPVSIDEGVRVSLVGADGHLRGIERGQRGGSYTVTALVREVGDVDGGLTQNRLRATGTDYPEDIADVYLQVPGPLGPASQELLDRILAGAASDSPYDIAAETARLLRDPTEFRYDTDVSAIPCYRSFDVECFVVHKVGFCQHYATTMAILLRHAGIPTRYVEGFLPGVRPLGTTTETLRNSAQHAWVEVYFPGYGWVEFEATGGGVSQRDELPVGRRDVEATPRPSAPAITRPPESEPPSPAPGAGGVGTPTSPAGAGPMIAVALLLVIAVGGLAAVAWRRGPRGEVTPDGTYGMLTRLAGRFGFGPRPEQTVYEYAGALGEVLPGVRPEIATVAQAKVEVAYGRRVLEDDRVRALRDAHRRLRTGLLRLAFMRRGRPRS
jgi:transglutaminase-like putative cysteine protease